MLLFTFAGQSEWIVLFLFGGTQWKNKKSKSLRSCQWSCQRRSSWTTPLKPCRNLYEPMSVSHILRLGQKESRWTPQPESSGIRFYRSFNSLARYLVEDHVRIILLCKSKNFVYIISGLRRTGSGLTGGRGTDPPSSGRNPHTPGHRCPAPRTGSRRP